MISISLDYKQVLPFVPEEEIRLFDKEAGLHKNNILNKTGKGSDFLGWVNLPEETDEDTFCRLEADAQKITAQSDVVVVIGIGGSYLGARAVIEALSETFPATGNEHKKQPPEICYAGHHLDEGYHYGLLKYLDNKDYSVIVISKSGTTTEPAIAFRLLRSHLEAKYGVRGAAERTIAITDARRGALKQMAGEQGYTTYAVPDDVGGRYSVLTPAGLLPIAVSGVNIRKLVAGSKTMASHLISDNTLENNPAATYAVIRNILYRKGKTTEILASYNPSLFYFTEWWKQLFGESEGKDGKGIFPAGVAFTTDLHSLGQYIQDGLKNFFETVIDVEETHRILHIPADPENLDGLNYIAGKRLSYVNAMAIKGTLMAHVDGAVPNIKITIPSLNEQSMGELIYFFEMACAFSGYILGVNPFDQPGVEAYKRNMFELLGKPGAGP